MRAHRVRTVAAFEFLAVVRSKSWLITTFGMPVFLAIYGGIASIPRWLESRRAETAVYGVVDAASVLALSADVSQSAVQVPDAVRDVLSRTGRGGEVGRTLARFNDVVFRPFGDEAAARAEVLSRTIKGYFVLPADYRETGHVTLVAGERALGSSEARAALSKLLLERLLAGNVPDDLASRIREPIAKTERFTLTSAGELVQGGVVALVLRFALPLVMMMLLMISILMSAGALVQATAIEKENKVVEVLLSSAPSEEILLGKLLGLGGAGALQIAVWFSMIGVGSLVFAATLATMGIEMPWLGLVTAALVFPLAYLFYGSLMLGTGSIGSHQREANQWGMIWSLFLVVPLIFLESLLREPHGTAGHVLTWIPPFTPLALVLRATIDPTGMPMWEIAGALALLVVATWLAIRLSARLFRVGILLTGARPKLRQIWRQSRL
jgi:ABC-2 type transport system permease protein